MRAVGRGRDVDSEGCRRRHAQLLDGQLVAGQGVDPAAQARAALVGQREQALGRPLFRGIPARFHQPGLLHALQRAVDAGRIGLLAAEHGRARGLLHDDVAVHGLVAGGEQREDGGLREAAERFAQRSAFNKFFFRLRIADAQHLVHYGLLAPGKRAALVP